MTTREEKARLFRELHLGDPFLIPNPWDAGTARVLQGMGFKALATTSSGFAFTLGRLDGKVVLEEVLAHIQLLDSVTDLPISADLENGYGAEAEEVARTVALAGEAGAVGGSIEDYDPEGHLYELGHAVERVEAAVEAARGLPFTFTLTARAENHIRGNPNLEDTVSRLQAFESAGADVLYAPGLRTTEEIRAVCGSVSGPVNVLASPGLTVREIFEAGAQRVSVGGRLTFVALAAMVDVAGEMRDDGGLTGLATQLPLEEWLL